MWEAYLARLAVEEDRARREGRELTRQDMLSCMTVRCCLAYFKAVSALTGAKTVNFEHALQLL